MHDNIRVYREYLDRIAHLTGAEVYVPAEPNGAPLGFQADFSLRGVDEVTARSVAERFTSFFESLGYGRVVSYGSRFPGGTFYAWQFYDPRSRERYVGSFVRGGQRDISFIVTPARDLAIDGSVFVAGMN